MAFMVTEAAAEEIKRIMESQKREEGTVVRMGVAGGGCAGLQYALGFDTSFDPKIDTRYEHHGVSIVTRKDFALHLDGAKIDFADGPTGRGFAVDNPNYVSRCPGCGGH